MNLYPFFLAGAALTARASGALFWPKMGLLCVSDLHLGKSERMARRGGLMLPPYETQDTLARLEAEIEATGAACVLCLGDSFDDLRAGLSLPEVERLWLLRLMAGRDWIWVEGNHDPGPLDLGGRHLASFCTQDIHFRHIASRITPEISGHYHPKASLSMAGRQVTRPCFLIDKTRVVMPAFGTYTGGLSCTDRALTALMAPDALAVLTGAQVCPVPMFKCKQGRQRA